MPANKKTPKRLGRKWVELVDNKQIKLTQKWLKSAARKKWLKSPAGKKWLKSTSRRRLTGLFGPGKTKIRNLKSKRGK